MSTTQIDPIPSLALEAISHLSMELHQTKMKVAEKEKLIHQMQLDLEAAKKQSRVFEQSLSQIAPLAALGEHSCHISHEIKGPLTSIRLLSELSLKLLRSVPTQVNQVSENSNSILKSLIRIEQIIAGLESFYGSLSETNFELTNPAEILWEAASLCGPKLKQHGIQLTIDDSTQGPPILCSRIQISQVLINLLNNACDSIELQDKKWIQIALRNLPGFTQIEVKDSGVRLSPELRSKVFEAAFTTKEKGRGSGIGLYLSKKIIEHHQGTIEVDEHSEFCAFQISLPKTNKIVTYAGK
ncbi:MAG: ATP-binding protein [Bdellovibrionia bacterium]